ncbi:uncharacterized protein BDW43DRAFT_26959 [Aspergillus alliaceus]|uniref:uncharacterized protein n=1 Tax=Petromyces alliaceus TaxID=209559 RepID=UPI0012A6AE5E|nr:uncharacterized protein BDW43DRAFT_26959 [Aspergillus alliaceus]KAB8235804.1 hypothetical protein BDW43DRAFT_26959 [Aspergillus alliaceus]
MTAGAAMEATAMRQGGETLSGRRNHPLVSKEIAGSPPFTGIPSGTGTNMNVEFHKSRRNYRNRRKSRTFRLETMIWLRNANVMFSMIFIGQDSLPYSYSSSSYGSR